MNKCIVCDAKIFTNHGKIKNGDYAKKFLNDYSLKICKKCGLSFIYPVPPDEVLKVIYSNPEYSAWSTAELTDRTNIRFSNFIYYFNIINKYIGKGKILDCGCATGFFLDIAKKNGFDSYGIEISDIPFSIANKKHPNKIYKKHLEELDLDKNSFDIISMFDFLEHTKNPKNILLKAKLLLSKNGILIITTPDTSSLTMKFLGLSHTNYILEHLNIFNKKNIRTLLEKTGFEVLEIRPAKKILSLDYAEKVFKNHNNILWKPICLLNRLVGKIKFYPVKVSFGDMLIIAKKISE